MVPATPASLSAAAEGLAALDYSMLRAAQHRGGGYPALYASGMLYRPEPIGSENWLNIAEALKAGQADCEDLSAWRAAELRHAGEPATVVIRPTRRGSYHAVVRRSDGTFEDPSRILINLERQGKQ